MLKEYKLYRGKEIIRFEDKPFHRFWDKKGNPLLSVTAITGIVKKPESLTSLMGWAVNQMGDYLLNSGEEKITQEIIEKAKKEYRRIKREAADVGSLIHEWVSDWILGKEPEMPDDERVINGITAFLKFQKEHKIKWLESERIVYSRKYKFAGILDAVGKQGKDLLLVDFKSSNGIYEEMRFQVAGYQIAWEEETGKKFDKRLILRFGKNDGEFEVFELNDDEKDKKAFLACLTLKRRLKELSKK